ncbi:acetyl esterase [Rhodococcus rhodochrous J3]|uniref:Acetyl esterase n=1 Tax=Rhodococcus rhodochrous J3 TaxID=903528 RepID=A0ABY1MAH3_RHORH|nr:alpha/beta hydrolase [Rhodococcus rhodochrous]MBF4479420.1 alpha/beta hydrolase [Rhodococcus rhodochrous]SMG35780.1 acetyl esterase [Rhodococcus rhodochrous J3]
MPLSPDAQRVVDNSAARMAKAMHEIPVAELRAALAASAIPVVTPIHQSRDVVVPSAGGGVRVRIYRPSDDPGLPVVQWMHSGGFAVGNLDQNEEYLRKLSIASQAVIVSVDYRLAPEHPCPAALDDCREVWEWITSAPDELRSVDVTRAVLAGESAGGALSFALSHQLRDEGLPLPAAQISLYGTAVMEVTNPEHATALLSPEDCYWFWGMYVPDPADRNSRQASPGLAPDLGGLPPALVVTAEIDPTRDGTEEYARRMQEAGVQVDLRRYEGMMHGFATMTTVLPAAKELFDRIVDYLAEVFTRRR